MCKEIGMSFLELEGQNEKIIINVNKITHIYQDTDGVTTVSFDGGESVKLKTITISQLKEVVIPKDYPQNVSAVQKAHLKDAFTPKG